MLVSDYDFTLPPGLIAQKPAPDRDGSRLLVLDKTTGRAIHRAFSDIPEYLVPGDVLVINDTKVFPASLKGVKTATGGKVEALLLKDLGEGRYLALMKGRLPPGTEVVFGGRLAARVGEDLGDGKKTLVFDGLDGLEAALNEVGKMPLPPYIGEEGRDYKADRERYQTVYASKTGAVAAPTAGLHFTMGLLQGIRDMGVHVAPVTLHVGIGTFLPVRVDEVEEHVMEEEGYEVSEMTAAIVNSARADGRRVIAVGTTSARTLESASEGSGTIKAGFGSTRLFIYPGYRFKTTDCLVTNFHLPKSTLLMLVCALAGRETMLAAYKEAIDSGYRFYSYGDAMFIHQGKGA